MGAATCTELVPVARQKDSEGHDFRPGARLFFGHHGRILAIRTVVEYQDLAEHTSGRKPTFCLVGVSGGG